VTIGTGMNHILATVHAEWDEATSKITSEKGKFTIIYQPELGHSP
jgi:hypothetical protein